MVRRSEDEWQALFAEQAASGLSVKAFCESRGMCNGYFSSKRRKLAGQGSATGFVPVRVKPTLLPTGFQLQWRDCRLSLPGDVSPGWVADLLKSLY